MRTPRLRLVLGLLVAGVFAGGRSAAAEAQVVVPDGATRPTTARDLAPHPQQSKTYNEFWSYQIFLENDLQLYLNFSRANLAPVRDPVCGADLSVVGFQGRTYTVAREYKVKNFSFDPATQRLQVHPKIWFRGNLPGSHEVHFETRKDGTNYRVHLTFTDIRPGMAWGDGVFRLGGDQRIGMFIHIPYARVTGTVSINGEEMRVRGTAYMDHTYQTDVVPRLVSGGLRYVRHSGEMEVGYILFPERSYGDQPIGYGLRLKPGGAELRRPSAYLAAASERVDGINVVRTAVIEFESGESLTLERVRDRQRLPTFHELSGLERRLARMFLGGEIVYVRSSGRLKGADGVAYSQLVIR